MTTGIAADGSLALAYLPKAQTLTIDLSKLNGLVRGRWFDPTDGSSKIIDGSPFENRGTRELTPPPRNSAGDADWALALETQVP